MKVEQCRGAPFGRPSVYENTQSSPKVSLARVELNASGYDRSGSYWGRGAPLFRSSTNDGSFETFFRDRDRSMARAFVRKTIPDARFYR